MTGLHPADITKVLGTLRGRGFLQAAGGDGAARYRYQLGSAARYALGALTVSSPVDADRGVEDLPALSPVDSAATLRGHETNPEGLELSPEGNGQRSEGSADQPEGLWPVLSEIAGPVRTRGRLPATRRNDIIVRLCTLAPLSLRQLADLLGRSEPHMRDVLRPLLASGRLRFAYPDQPSHPRQQYRAADPQPGDTAASDEDSCQ